MSNVAGIKLVTIVSEPVLVSRILDTIRTLGATGYTMSDVKGEGSGAKRSGEVPYEKVKIEVIVESDLSEKIMEKISKAYFENYSLIVYACDIQVVRREKF
jgi:nitrogen regulatory protein P-II 2